jgi:hypothetical protein
MSKTEESFTWTFYRFGTVNGPVTVRWLGTSNGYYSESAAFEEKIRPRPPCDHDDCDQSPELAAACAALDARIAGLAD